MSNGKKVFIREDGTPVRVVTRYAFGKRVKMYDAASRQECLRCNNEYWAWSGDEFKLCAPCRFRVIHKEPPKNAGN